MPPGVAGTLTVAAFTGEPTTTLLIRAGRADAARDLRLAEAAGLIERDGEAGAGRGRPGRTPGAPGWC